VHVVVAPLTFHVRVPAGAGKSVEPEIKAVKVSVCPTVGLEGVALTKIVAVACPKFIVNVVVVAGV